MRHNPSFLILCALFSVLPGCTLKIKNDQSKLIKVFQYLENSNARNKSETVSLNEACLTRGGFDHSIGNFSRQRSSISHISPQPLRVEIEIPIDTRRVVEQSYEEEVTLPSIVDGIPMTDGKEVRTIIKTRKVTVGEFYMLKATCFGSLYHIYN